MHLRPATREDMPDMAELTCEAFKDDHLYQYRFPNMQKYPISYRKAIVDQQRNVIVLRGFYFFVVVSDSSDISPDNPRPLLDASGRPVPEGTILGRSCWQRRCKPSTSNEDPYNQNNTSLFFTFERALLNAQNLYLKYICPNQAASRTAAARLSHLIAMEMGTHDALKDRIPHWYLAGLSVWPEFQGRGVGRMLVQWGLDRATEEWNAASPEARRKKEVAQAVTLHASPSGLILYEKMGFKKLGDDEKGVWNVKFNPDAPGRDWACVWDPLSMWTRRVPKKAAGAADLYEEDFVAWDVKVEDDEATVDETANSSLLESVSGGGETVVVAREMKEVA